MTIAPIKRSVLVGLSPARAFDAFTRDIGRWWPAPMHIGKADFADVVLEPREGGRWFERAADGTETDWGHVLDWQAGKRLLLAWRIDATWQFDPSLLTEVEILFTPTDDGTHISLEHRRLENFGESAARIVAMLEGGWSRPLDSFAAYLAKHHR